MNRILSTLLLLAGLQASCQSTRPLQKTDFHSLVFYNVENLFDTINDPTTNDEEFLPNARVAWNTERYNRKLSNIARVFAAIDSTDFPHLIGLAEVENKTVLEDLVRQPQIADAKYGIIHVSDDDPRGIEVAILYRSDIFKPLNYNGIEFQDSVPERHILYTTLLNGHSDTLHVFVNHWKSRGGGQEATAPLRMAAAQALRLAIDALQAAKPHALVVVMGDFNDNPTDESITKHLKALAPEQALRQPAALVNLAAEAYSAGQGTLYFDGWHFFDQMMVSQSLWQGKRLRVKSFEVFSRPWMLYNDNRGNARPNRTMSGSRYFGGYSDHLPVVLRLQRVR